MHAQDLTYVKQVLRNLERDDRYIVLLYYADNLTPDEIALVLDLPPTKVRSTLDRLRGRLLRAIERGQAQTLEPTEPPFAQAKLAIGTN